jgi:DNA replication and repair protein RecF
MILSDLKINDLRTLSSVHLKLNPRFNCITGPNGSGKTSVLEALYLLSCGHSFRSREITPIISFDQSALTVFARAEDNSTISIQKSSTSATQIKLNNQFCSTTSQLAYALPCQVFYSEIFQIIDAGPTVRRAILDWGLFHVKPPYLELLKQYKKVLKQRNALLKRKAPYPHFIPWDLQLCDLALQIDELRAEFFILWQEQFYKVLSQLTQTNCSISYYKGWDRRGTGKPLLELLEEHFQSDIQRQFTQYGAHQADFIIESQDHKAKNILSRGQQKIILIALKLAQSLLLDKPCLYLFDDLPAELDDKHLERLFAFLSAHPGQSIITSLNQIPQLNIDTNEINLFSINSGHLSTLTTEIINTHTI